MGDIGRNLVIHIPLRAKALQGCRFSDTATLTTTTATQYVLLEDSPYLLSQIFVPFNHFMSWRMLNVICVHALLYMPVWESRETVRVAVLWVLIDLLARQGGINVRAAKRTS